MFGGAEMYGQGFYGQQTQQYNGFNPLPQVQQFGQPQSPMQQPSDVIQVNGMDGARAYQMRPNSRALLLDSNDPVVYIKSTDGAGFPTLNAYRLTPIEQQQAQAAEPATDYGDRIKKLEKQMEELINESVTARSSNSNASGKQRAARNDAADAADGRND